MFRKILFAFSLLISAVCYSQNPIIQTKYTADPAPLVWHDTVFLYTGHDENNAFGFLMKDWQLYTSTDMVNWTDHGAVASLKNFKWVSGDNGPGQHRWYSAMASFTCIALCPTMLVLACSLPIVLMALLSTLLANL